MTGVQTWLFRSENIPPEGLKPHSQKLGAEPGERYLVEGGRYRVTGEGIAMSIDSGEGMGVGNAVEDFVDKGNAGWRWANWPILNGLTILWPHDHPRKGELFDSIECFKHWHMLHAVEKLRIDLLLHCIEVESELMRSQSRATTAGDVTKRLDELNWMILRNKTGIEKLGGSIGQVERKIEDMKEPEEYNTGEE